MSEYKLTQYSHGAGCGCKISPAVLDTILHSNLPQMPHTGLWVGNETRDDAAVFDLGDGTGIISTTDFFMPIVDDAFEFGRIAAVNAISDVYAMGGTPMLAIAILGWPIGQLPPEEAAKVIEGGRRACQDAGIPLAGGHSIDSPEPIFGLAVTGRVSKKHLKRNGGAPVGSILFLTKAIGVGILTTAQKKGLALAEHLDLAKQSMMTLNSAGAYFGTLAYVHAMTDVTGFGLLGHLCEMCEASKTSANIRFDAVPVIDRNILDKYIAQKCIPGGTNRNWDSYGHKIGKITDIQRIILADPQTSGGLLVAVAPEYADDFIEQAFNLGLSIEAFGELVERGSNLIEVV